MMITLSEIYNMYSAADRTACYRSSQRNLISVRRFRLLEMPTEVPPWDGQLVTSALAPAPQRRATCDERHCRRPLAGACHRRHHRRHRHHDCPRQQRRLG